MDPCAHCEEMMQPYLDHVLTDEEMGQAEAHLAECVGLPNGATGSRRACGSTCARRSASRCSAELRQKLAALRIPLGIAASTSPGGAQVVARDEAGRKRLRALVGDLVPECPREQDGVEADAAVGRGDGGRRRSCASPPRRGRPRADRSRARRRARRPRLRASAGSAASPQRNEAPGPRSHSGQGRSPLGSACAPLTTTISSTRALAQRREHLRQERDLLRRLRSVARRGAGGQDDGGNGHDSVSDTKTGPDGRLRFNKAKGSTRRGQSSHVSGSDTGQARKGRGPSRARRARGGRAPARAATFHSVRGSGVAASRSSRLSIRHGIGATPASAIRVEPSACRAAATPTCGNDQRLRSIALR